MGLNNELHEYQKEYDAGSRETEAKEALLNRLEGSIAHAKSQIEEKYGRYEEFECDNPEKFADDMSVAVAELEKNIEKYAQLRKHMSMSYSRSHGGDFRYLCPTSPLARREIAS